MAEPWNTTPLSLKRKASLGTKPSRRHVCQIHNALLDVYCCSDGQVLCSSCAFVDHKGHKTQRASDERRRKQVDLNNIKKSSKERLQLHEKEWKKLKKNLVQIQEGAREAEGYCESIIAQLIDCLQRHYGTVQELIEAQERAAVAKVQSSLLSLEREIEEIKGKEIALDQQAQNDDDVAFLQTWHSLSTLCEPDASPRDVEDPLLPFESVKRSVQEFGRQLEVFCDKEVNAISQHGHSTASSLHTKQPANPKHRAEFLAFACEVTFDPNTAHKDLILSGNDKEVNVSQDKSRQHFEPHAERFTHRRQLLCAQGLRECCYYEVEVYGDKAEIALAYREIDRRSKTKSSAFGGNNKSWSLDRSNVYSVSHNGDAVQLSTSPSHHRVGVYLNYKEGVLTFYEVSGLGMTFLYRVEAKFTEPLYPGFWLGDKCCIRLCDLSQQNVPTG